MSHFTHPTISLRTQVRSHRAAVVAALIALVATAAITLAIALGSDGSETPRSAGVTHVQPTLRSGGGPEESAVAASVGSRPVSGPDESRIAASISGR